MKHFTRIIFPLVLILLLVFPVASYSQDGLNYVSFKGGAFFHDDKDFDDSFTAEITFGRHFHPNFAADCRIGYISIGDWNGKVNFGWGAVDANVDAWATPITLNAMATLPINRMNLYAGAGFGIYLMEARATFSYWGLPGSDETSEVVWGGHLMAGMQVDLSQHWFLGLEAKYISAESISLTAGGNTIKVEIDGHSTTGEIGFRF